MNPLGRIDEINNTSLGRGTSTRETEPRTAEKPQQIQTGGE